MITTTHQDLLASWLCKRIGLRPSTDLKCIGTVVDKKIIGVVGYDGYNGASVMMHVAGDAGWCTRSFMYAAFHYPFEVMKCRVVLGLIPCGNRAALRFNRHAGFDILSNIHDAHPDGSLVLMVMPRSRCRFLEPRYGKEVKTASAT